MMFYIVAITMLAVAIIVVVAARHAGKVNAALDEAKQAALGAKKSADAALQHMHDVADKIKQDVQG